MKVQTSCLLVHFPAENPRSFPEPQCRTKIDQRRRMAAAASSRGMEVLGAIRRSLAAKRTRRFSGRPVKAQQIDFLSMEGLPTVESELFSTRPSLGTAGTIEQAFQILS